MNPDGGGGGASGDPPWAWEEARWRGHVGRVRAGRTLKPAVWPDGAAVAVALSFDADHETIPLRSAETHPGKLSQGEYGARVAVPRILRLLDRHRVPASFFVPAVSALLHPQETATCAAAGHEIALHGWIHEWNTTLDRETERDLLGPSQACPLFPPGTSQRHRRRSAAAPQDGKRETTTSTNPNLHVPR